MQISIIGTGNVAAVLAKRLHTYGHRVVEIIGRNKEGIKEVLQLTGAAFNNDIKKINNSAHVVIVAVADKAITDIVHELSFLNNSILVHTAGSMPMSVLESGAANIGVIYPIQTIRKDMDDATPIPFAIEANSNATLQSLKNLLSSIANKIVCYNSEQRLQLHVAAVFACNFVNYMYVQSEQYCNVKQLDFSILQPLIEETALRLRYNSAKNVFTGPAKRKDLVTIQKHVEQLQGYDNALAIYELITQKIMQEF